MVSQFGLLKNLNFKFKGYCSLKTVSSKVWLIIKLLFKHININYSLCLGQKYIFNGFDFLKLRLETNISNERWGVYVDYFILAICLNSNNKDLIVIVQL